MAAVPEASHRLYNCRRCGEQVQVCRGCDRGNIYCAGECAGLSRRESLRRPALPVELSRGVPSRGALAGLAPPPCT